MFEKWLHYATENTFLIPFKTIFLEYFNEGSALLSSPKQQIV
jgi:hypothetical protein